MIVTPTLLDLLQFYSALYADDDLLRLYHNEINVDKLTVNIDRDVMWRTIVDRCGACYTACDNISSLIYRTQNFISTNADVFNQLAKIFFAERDYLQTRQLVTTVDGKDVRTPDLTHDGETTRTPELTSETVTGISAANQTGFSDRERVVTGDNGKERTTNNYKDTGTDTKNYNSTTTVKGYDGSPAELYQKAIEVESSFSLYKFIAEMYDNEICLGVY